MAHQHVGLAEIQQAAGVGELFDTLLVFENYPVDRAGLAAQAQRAAARPGRGPRRDALSAGADRAAGRGAAAAARLPARPVRRGDGCEALGERLMRLLEGCGGGRRPCARPACRSWARPSATPSCGAGTTPRMRRRTGMPAHGAAPGDGEAGAADAATVTAALTLPALFAAQAARTPDAVAVVFEDRALSYAALDAHANRLAHHLQSLGVGPETMVGLCVERSPEMVIGLLGILKAGGAYLPLDPNYPRERLAFMLADAGCPVLVTQQALHRAAAASSGGRRRGRPGIVRLDADGPAIARQPEHRAAARSRSAPPGLCDLHLGLDRQPQRASW